MTQPSRYVVGEEDNTEAFPQPEDARRFHFWEHAGLDIETMWDCTDGGDMDDRPPAACGVEGVVSWVTGVRGVFDSLTEALRHPSCCRGCARAVADRHGIPESRVQVDGRAD